MTAHQLAKALLELPDLPVIINGWGWQEGTPCEVSDALDSEDQFHGVSDDAQTPKDHLGYPIARKCVFLQHL